MGLKFLLFGKDIALYFRFEKKMFVLTKLRFNEERI